MTEELVEAIARKLYEASCVLDPLDPNREPDWSRSGYKTEVAHWHGLARAVIPVVLEEAAKVAEEYGSPLRAKRDEAKEAAEYAIMATNTLLSEAIAKAIRNLGSI